MNILSTFLIVALLILAPRIAQAQAAWKPASAPLMTRWAADVNPANPLPEYPRPQLTRDQWQSLNGLWEYAVRDAADPAPTEAAGGGSATHFDGSILVPFPIESALSGVGKPCGPNDVLWYHRRFTVPAWSGKRVLLHFGAVDWKTIVWVNGHRFDTHRGGFDDFSYDITDALRPGKPQDILVRVYDETGEGQARGKQSLKPEGIFYTPVTGIWQTVWIEPVEPAHIDSLHIVPDIDQPSVVIQARVAGMRAGDTLRVEALEAGRVVARTEGPASSVLTLKFRRPQLWTPERPFLYNLRLTLQRDGHVLDRVGSYFGLRKISLGRDRSGVRRLMLNNRVSFQVGPLDQGFWPDGTYTAPTDAALRSDIETMKRLGFNMCRKHVKVEPERWYYWADKLGLLVWQDMPANFETNRPPAGGASNDWRPQFEHELDRLIEGRFNHPSIVMWVVFNEGWGQYDTARLVDRVRAADPTRLIDNASGWTDQKVGDVIDMHNYPGPGSPKPEASRAAVLGEFGGLGLGVDGHTWARKHWGYREMADKDRLTGDYVRLLNRVHELETTPGLSACVYTQLTDVETECNGLLTYDRAVLKPDAARVSAANRAGPATVRHTVALVPTARDAPQRWRYTTDRPSADWFRSEFDDSSWKKGLSGFGTAGTPGAIIGTTWSTDDIWLRRTFELPTVPKGRVRLSIHHDEDVEVYINGVLADSEPGYIAAYDVFDMSPAALHALKPGANNLAVHCHQTTGGQYIDVGVIEER